MPGSIGLVERKPHFSLIVVACGVAILLAEGLLRLFFPTYIGSAGIEQNYFCRFDPEIGWRPITDISGRHQRKDFSVLVHQNQFGLRGPNTMRREKTSDTDRMLILGDSYVWGFGVDQELIFTQPQVHQSEKELINFGVSGYGTDQEYLFYLREGALFEADEVVLAITPYNDVENNLSLEQYDKLKPYYTLSDQHLVLHTDHVKENKVQTAIDWVWSNSRVVNILDKAYRIVQRWWFLRHADRGVANSGTGILNAAAISPRDREGLRLTMRIIEDLRDSVVAHGARFSVIFIPYKPHILGRVSKNHPFVPLLAQSLEEVKIDYYEPFFLFLDDHNRGQLFNEFDNHFSQKGHALFAKALVDPLLSEAIRNLYSGEAETDRTKERKVS